MKRRMLSILVAAMLLAAALSCVAEAGASGPDERLTEDLLNCLGVYERMYGDMLWALDYVERYDATRAWGDLQIARMALNVALEDMLDVTEPNLTLTLADLDALLEEGIDASFILEYGMTFDSDRRELLDICVNYNDKILFQVFAKGEWKQAVEHMRLFAERAECYLQYSAITVDWLTTQTRDAAWAEDLGRRLRERCPETSARRLKGEFSAADAEALAETLVYRLLELDVPLSESVGRHQYQYDSALDAYASDDYLAKLIGDRAPISGLSALVPEPYWDDLIASDVDLDQAADFEWEDALAQTRMYYWRNDDGTLDTPAAREALTAPPDVCVAQTRNVSRDEVEQYCAALDEAEGMTRLDATSDGEGLTVTYQAGESTLVVEWEDGTATLCMPENPVCFAPEWYVEGE